jgi:putative tricarboxylic transport membrane protein
MEFDAHERTPLSIGDPWYQLPERTGLPKAVLVPTIGLLTAISSYAIHNNVDDAIVMVGLGVLRWVVNRFGYP